MADSAPICNIYHPDYVNCRDDWYKYRLTYEGGDLFISEYLEKFSTRETDSSFATRKSMTYCPAFAASALNEVRNSIYQRINDVTREGGTESYTEAIQGRNRGVDLHGSTMNGFMGTVVLHELLSMGKVGIYVDMPELEGITLAQTFKQHPYLYHYPVENIRSWKCSESRPDMLEFLLLEDRYEATDSESGLVCGYKSCLRYLAWSPDGILVRFYDMDGLLIKERFLKLSRIPFVMPDIGKSLLKDVCNHQIALLNMESSDVAYVLKSNFPFYVEQYQPGADMAYTDKGPVPTGEAEDKKISVGAAIGRRYPKGMDQPAFINPSPEPLQAAMAKEEQIKKDIRILMNLSIANLQQKMASAESKSYDVQGLEAGLSYIGMTLETSERVIAELWAEYEGSNALATIQYPEKYSLQSEEDRRAEAMQLKELLSSVPSRTFQREVKKLIAYKTVGQHVSANVIKKIEKEVDADKAMTADPKVVDADLEKGVLSLELAAELHGYPSGTVEAAKEDHAERLSRIAESQAAKSADNPDARGLPDMSGSPGSGGKAEKIQSKDTTGKESTDPGVRGDGRHNG